MFKAICIRRYDSFVKGDIINVKYKNSDKVYYLKEAKGLSKFKFLGGFNLGQNLLYDDFKKYFLEFEDEFVVEKPPLKRRFRRPKPQELYVTFKGISEEALKELYNCVFSYIELTRQIDSSLILTFNYSIVSTLEELEKLYGILEENQFMEAIKSSEQVFRGLYKTALSIDIANLPRVESHEQLLRKFKEDSNIVGSFFEELNKDG